MATNPTLEEKLFPAERIVGICRWISFIPDQDPKDKLLHMAHAGRNEEVKRDARVALAKFDWCEYNLDPEDYRITTYAFPLWEFGGFDFKWYTNLRKHGCQPTDLYYQICIEFAHELDAEMYHAGTSEIY